MNENFYRIASVVLFIFFLIAVALLLGKSILLSDNENKNILGKKIDTLIIAQKSEPIIIEKVKPKIKYRTDTIIKTMPFETIYDTIIKYDTIQVRYKYPENWLDLQIRKKPDTTIIHTVQFNAGNLGQKQYWWEKPLIFLTGASIGFILKK